MSALDHSYRGESESLLPDRDSVLFHSLRLGIDEQWKDYFFCLDDLRAICRQILGWTLKEDRNRIEWGAIVLYDPIRERPRIVVQKTRPSSGESEPPRDRVFDALTALIDYPRAHDDIFLFTSKFLREGRFSKTDGSPSDPVRPIFVSLLRAIEHSNASESEDVIRPTLIELEIDEIQDSIDQASEGLRDRIQAIVDRDPAAEDAVPHLEVVFADDTFESILAAINEVVPAKPSRALTRIRNNVQERLLRREHDSDLEKRLFRYFLVVHLLVEQPITVQYHLWPTTDPSVKPVLALILGCRELLPRENIHMYISHLTHAALPIAEALGHREAYTALAAARRSALAGIMSRNMSHNIGSHVLASPELLNNVHWLDIQTLHNFLQLRMDFIAQVVTYSPSWGEPVFFYKDLLRGFFDQYLLLSHLIRDQGYGTICFKVHHEGYTWTFELEEEKLCARCRASDTEPSVDRCCQMGFWQPTGRWQVSGKCGGDLTAHEASGKSDDDLAAHDVLIAVPGGLVGMQAFYDILENLMRNSAKYGQSANGSGEQPTAYEMHIALDVEQTPNFRLTIWDNLSADPGQEISNRLNAHIERPIVEAGTTHFTVEHRGLREIDECAKILASDSQLDPVAGPWSDSGGRSSASICFGSTADGQLKAVFPMLRPSVMTVASPQPQHDGQSFGIDARTLDAAFELDRCSPQLMVIVPPESDAARRAFFDRLGKRHRHLPHRLLVIGEPPEKALQIPARRVVWCPTDSLNLDPPTDEAEAATQVGAVYDRWLRGLHPLPDRARWQLLIFVERVSGTLAFERWKEALTAFQSDTVEIHVVRTSKSDKSMLHVEASSSATCWQTLRQRLIVTPEHCLVFANHGLGLSGLGYDFKRSRLRFYHEIGARQLKLFHTIESPPPAGISFSLLAYGLVESALARVVIIDERLADAVFSDDRGILGNHHVSGHQRANPTLKDLTAAGCYPCFSIRTPEPDDRHFISKAIERRQHALQQRFDPDADESGGTPLADDEGLVCTRDASRMRAQGPGQLNAKPRALELPQVDIVVVHQGIIDSLGKSGCWPEQAVDWLNNLAPAVVITSGRGRTPTRATDLFVEFSIIRENTYVELSKYHLVRSLLATRGQPSEGIP